MARLNKISRKLFLLILIFIFSTGFIKSKVEKCADKKVNIDYVINPFSIKTALKTEAELKKDSSKIVKILNEQIIRNNAGKKSKYLDKLDGYLIKDLRSKSKIVTYRSMDIKIQKRKFKKFINKNEKTKLENSYYEESFKICIKEKKVNPELFNAKY